MRFVVYSLALVGLIGLGLAAGFFLFGDGQLPQISLSSDSDETDPEPSQQVPVQPAPAQQAQSGRSAPTWTVNCANTQAGLECRAIQTLFVRQTGQRVLALAVRMPPDSKRPVMMIETPFRTYLPAGILMRFNGQAEKKIPYQHCHRSGCLAVYNVTEAEIGSLLRGTDLTVSIQDMQRRPLTLVVPAVGFADAYARIQ